MTNKGFSSQPGPRAISPGVAEGAREDMGAERLRLDATALADALRRLLAAFEGLRPFPLVVDAVAQGLIADAKAALRATSQTPDAVREACAAICDRHAEWAENKIEDGDDPSSSTSQMWACMSNTANDLAEMIRKDLPSMSPSAPNKTPDTVREDGYEHTLLLSMALTINGLAKIGKMTNDEVLAVTNKVFSRIDEHRALSTPSASAGPQAEAVALNHEGARRYAEAVFDYTDENLTKFDAMDADPALAQQLFDAAKALLAMLNGSFPTVLAHPQPQQADVRGAVIEECAQIAEAQNWCGGGAIVCGDVIARRIRALQQSPATDNAPAVGAHQRNTTSTGE